MNFLIGRARETSERITDMFRTLDREDFPATRRKIKSLALSLGDNHPDLVRAHSLITFLEG